MIRDRDGIYGDYFRRRVESFGIEVKHPLGATTSAARRNRAATQPPSRRNQPRAARNSADCRPTLLAHAGLSA
jgi:hypothetical protein